VVAEFAALLKSYGVSTAYGDRYGAEWVKGAFERHGISLRQSPHDRSSLYLNLLPALNAGQVKLLDLPRLRSQLLSLERRTIRGSGRDVVDHPSGGADDLINACAGALVMAAGAESIARYTGPPLAVPRRSTQPPASAMCGTRASIQFKAPSGPLSTTARTNHMIG
jgi:hypothetical protein